MTKRVAPVDDVRLPVDFWSHRKTRKLIKRLGLEGPVSFQRLWCYASQRRPDGVLSGLSNEDIALEAHWEGDPDEFVEGLLEVGYLDKDGDELALHEWAEHQPWVASKPERTEKAKALANLRHHGSPDGKPKTPAKSKGNKTSQSAAHAETMRDACEPDAKRNAPSLPLPATPHPSQPAAITPAREEAAEEDEVGDFSSEEVDPAPDAEPAKAGPAFPAPLEGFHELVDTWLRLTQKGLIVTEFDRMKLRRFCEEQELPPREIVKRINRWEADLAARKRKPEQMQIGHPNYFRSIMQDYAQELPAASNIVNHPAAQKPQKPLSDEEKRAKFMAVKES